ASDDWNRYLVHTSTPDAPTVVFAGDSVPLLLGHAAAEQVDDLGVNVGSVAIAGCNILAEEGPVRDIAGTVVTGTGCGEPDRFRDGVLAYEPDVSILLFGRIHNNAVEIDGRWQLPCDAGYDDAYRRHTNRVIDELRAAGGSVALVSSPSSSVSWVLDAVPEGMDDRFACLNDILRDIAAERDGVGFVDLDTWICPEPGRCREQIDGV